MAQFRGNNTEHDIKGIFRKKMQQLVSRDRPFFPILGVSFIVMQNDINFIEIKKQKCRGTIQQVFYFPMLSLFLNWRSCCFLLRRINVFLIATAPLSFLMVAGWKLFFSQILLYIQVINLGVNMARQYFIFKIMFLIRYNNQFTVVQTLFFRKIFVKDN